MFPAVARDRRESCPTSAGDGFKKKNRSTLVCQAASVRQLNARAEERDSTGAEFLLHLVVSHFKRLNGHKHIFTTITRPLLSASVVLWLMNNTRRGFINTYCFCPPPVLPAT